MLSTLEDLTARFRVVSYSGGVQAGFEHLSVQNLFVAEPRDRAHCSDFADTYDLVLELRDEGELCTLTHLVVRGMRLADAPIRTGVMWVSDAHPSDIAARVARVGGDACTRETADADVDCDFFETSSDASMQHAAPLRHPRTGRFVHLRFLSAHFKGARRFDIGTIALLGFRGRVDADAPAVRAALLAPIPAALDVCVVEFDARALNPMHSDFLVQLQREACVHVFTSSASRAGAEAEADADSGSVINVVRTVAASGRYAGRLNFFAADGRIDDEDCIAAAIAAQIGVACEPSVVVVDADFANPKVLPADELAALTADSLCTWLDRFLSGGGSASKASPPPSSDVERSPIAAAATAAAASVSDEVEYWQDEQDTEPPVLSAPTIDALGDALRAGTFKKVIIMAGAGISVSCGIPDFRTPGTGLYSNLAKYNLPTPESVFDIEFFRQNPQPFCMLAKELFPGQYAPSRTHHFVKLLADRGLLLRCYTQNIDGLERLAGVDPDRLIEAHGTFASAHCIDCEAPHDSAQVRAQLVDGTTPRCSSCNGLVKPDIVFFGEALPRRFFECAQSDFVECDLLIVMGTSLQVQPFSKLINMVARTVPRVLINREPVALRRRVPLDVVRSLEATGQQINWSALRAGFAFDLACNTRDIFIGGDCDHGTQLLAHKMGAADALSALEAKARVSSSLSSLSSSSSSASHL